MLTKGFILEESFCEVEWEGNGGNGMKGCKRQGNMKQRPQEAGKMCGGLRKLELEKVVDVTTKKWMCDEDLTPAVLSAHDRAASSKMVGGAAKPEPRDKVRNGERRESNFREGEWVGRGARVRVERSVIRVHGAEIGSGGKGRERREGAR